MHKNKLILIILCGKSPAVITETVYALSKEDLQKTPDEIVVITTTDGRKTIKEELFDKNNWFELSKQITLDKTKLLFGLSSSSIRIIPEKDRTKDASDISTTENNETAADFILSTLREFTENPNTEIILSIAGGRKTMSALAAMSMSLLGRYSDRLCHVLVNPPFVNPNLMPKFYYPNEKIHSLTNESEISSKEAKITLNYIPFVRCRYLFHKRFGRLPGNYTDTVELANMQISSSLDAPDIHLDPHKLECMIGKSNLKLSPAEFALYWLLALQRKHNGMPIHGQDILHDEFIAFSQSTSSSIMPSMLKFDRFKAKQPDDMRKLIHSISTKIKKQISYDNGLELCSPTRDKGIYGLGLSPSLISCPKNY